MVSLNLLAAEEFDKPFPRFALSESLVLRILLLSFAVFILVVYACFLFPILSISSRFSGRSAEKS